MVNLDCLSLQIHPFFFMVNMFLPWNYLPLIRWVSVRLGVQSQRNHLDYEIIQAHHLLPSYPLLSYQYYHFFGSYRVDLFSYYHWIFLALLHLPLKSWLRSKHVGKFSKLLKLLERFFSTSSLLMKINIKQDFFLIYP